MVWPYASKDAQLTQCFDSSLSFIIDILLLSLICRKGIGGAVPLGDLRHYLYQVLDHFLLLSFEGI